MRRPARIGYRTSDYQSLPWLVNLRPGAVPEISRFFGIVIQMHFAEHPPPHFHATYGDHNAQFCIDPFGLLEGALPRRALALVAEWTKLHQVELLENWRRLRAGEPTLHIAPLE